MNGNCQVRKKKNPISSLDEYYMAQRAVTDNVYM